MEIWKDIKGYEGLYKVSNKGRIWSNISNKELTLIPTGRDNLYKSVSLCKNGEVKRMLVHRLVALHFVDNSNPETNNVVGHKLAVRFGGTNNASNLSWITGKENAIQAGIDGLMNRVPVNERAVLQIDKTGNIINEFKSINEAGKVTGLRVSHICDVCRGEKHRKTCGGFYWKYKNY